MEPHARPGHALGVLSPDDVPFLPVNPLLAEDVEGFAALAAARGDHVRAAELLGLAQTLRGYRDTASLEVTRTTALVTAEALLQAFGLDHAAHPASCVALMVWLMSTASRPPLTGRGQHADR